MTGRELIIHILKNGLENEDIFKDGKIVGLKTLSEVAERYGVGVETVRIWISLGRLDSVEIFGMIFVPANAILKQHSLKGDQ